jgi:hypothetical protein
MRVLLALLVALAGSACSPDASGDVSADFTFAVTDSADRVLVRQTGPRGEQSLREHPLQWTP